MKKQKKHRIIKEKTLNYVVAPVVTSDIMNGITYKGYFGQKVHKSKEEIESLRYIYENAISLNFIVHNDGNIKATDVRIKVYIPEDLAIISEEGMDSYYNEMDYRYNEIRCKRYYPSRYLLQLKQKFDRHP